MKEDEIIIVSGFVTRWSSGLFAIRDTVFKRKSIRDRSKHWHHQDCYWMILK